MTVLILGALLGLVALAALFIYRTRLHVRCTMDLEATLEHFHAHAELHDVAIEPGDEVLLHNAPSRVPLGTRRVYDTTATVRQASWLRRQWTRLIGGTEFHELYDVGFEG